MDARQLLQLWNSHIAAQQNTVNAIGAEMLAAQKASEAVAELRKKLAEAEVENAALKKQIATRATSRKGKE